MLPFTEAEFFAVLAAYNRDLGVPGLIAAEALGLASAALAISRRPWAGRAMAGILALLWLVMGAGYHWAQFTAVNPAAWGFGAGFVAEAGLLAWFGGVRDRLRPGPLRGWRGAVAAVLAAYALAAYPGATLALHPYPQAPMMGAPCPTTILTLALLLVAGGRTFWPLATIPLIWSAIGGSAAWLLGVVPDYGLVVAGLTALALGAPRPASPRSAGPASRGGSRR